MKIASLKNIDKKDIERIKKRSAGTYKDIGQEVKKIIDDVRKNGDRVMIKKYNTRYNTKKYTITVSKSDMQKAYRGVSKDFIRGVKQAVKNITCVHQAQLDAKKEAPIAPEKGIKVWREWRAIEKVGLYIPGGKAIYPSSVLMTGIPALLAGCKEIIMTSPPNQEGNIPSPTLVAADMIGIQKIYKVGGAQAIAAMAYGTKTISKVYKIFGAGNSYVTQAKMQVFGTVDIDMPAGPSEVFIIADETANPAFIAADLLADGEHGEDSACVLLSTSKTLTQKVNVEINKQLNRLLTKDRAKKSLEKYGLLAIVDSLDEAIAFTNDYAPEHLEIMTKNPKKVLAKITNAGSVFLGTWTSKAAGDYATGANHILPTGEMAKMFNPLSIDSFGKMMQVQIVESKEALRTIKKTMEVFGEIEQLPAHKNSASIRFTNNSYEK